MKTIIINNRTYRYADRLEELTLAQWQALMTYRDPETTSGNGPDKAYGILKQSIGIGEKILRQTDPEDLKRFLRQWSETIARQSSATLGKPDAKEARKTKGETCAQRNSAATPDDNPLIQTERPLTNLCAQAFCDATDLFLENPVQHARTIIAILCHPANRPYNETKIIQRAGKMKRLSMKRVTGLLDELATVHRLCRSWFPACYRKLLQENPMQEKSSQIPPSWNDTLLWLADYRPSEIRLTEQLPCYEFMRMLDSKLRNRQPESDNQRHPPHV